MKYYTLKELDYTLSGVNTPIEIVYANNHRKIFLNRYDINDVIMNTTISNIFPTIINDVLGYSIHLHKLKQ